MTTILQGAAAFPARLFVVVALLTALSLLVACSGGDKTSSAAGSGRSAEALLERSALVMAEVRSFRFTLVNKDGETPLPDGLGLRTARGAMAKPDKLDAQVTARVSGFPVEMKVISAEGRTYVTHPLTGRWQTYDFSLSPVAFFDPEKGVVQILRSMQQPSLTPGPRTGGAATSRVTGRLPASAVKFVTGSAIEGAMLDAELLIGSQDGLLREAKFIGHIAVGEPVGMSRVLEFSDFNQSFTIVPPQ